MSKYSRLGKNTLLVFIGTAGTKIIGLLMMPFYTHWLSVEDYGTTDMISVYVALLTSVITACIAESAFIFPKGQPKERQGSYFSTGLAYSGTTLAITALIFAVINTFAGSYGVSNSFTDNIWLIYGMIATQFLQQYIQQFVRSIDRMTVYSITGIVTTACTALFALLILPRWGVLGYVWSVMLANICAATYSLIHSGAYRYFNLRKANRADCLEMLKYSTPLIPNMLMWWLISALNRPMMESYLGLHSIGIYAVAGKFPAFLSMIFIVFLSSWQISVIEEFKKPDYEAFFNKIFRIVMALSLLLLFCFTIGSKVIVKVLSTDDYYEAWRYVGLLSLACTMSNVADFAGSTFIAIRKSKYFFYSSVWGAITAVCMNAIFIPRFGIMGAVVSVTIAFSVMALVRICFGWKYVHITHIPRHILMLLLCLSLTLVIVYVEAVDLKTSLTALLFMLFLISNYDLKSDMVMAYHKITSLFLKKSRPE